MSVDNDTSVLQSVSRQQSRNEIPLTIYQPWAAFFCTIVLLVSVLAPQFRGADAPATESRDRLLVLDGLRGFAAWGVYLHHAVIYYHYLASGEWALPPCSFFVIIGQISVCLFFLITGFVFGNILVEKNGKLPLITFLLGRVFRIGPVYLLAISIMFLIVAFRSGLLLRVDPQTLSYELGGWLSLGISNGSEINGDPDAVMVLAGVTSTLQYEWLFYFCVPLIGLGVRWDRYTLVLLATLAAILGGLMFKGAYYFRHNETSFAFLLTFGVLAATLKSGIQTFRIPKVICSLASLGIILLIFRYSKSAYEPIAIVSTCASFLFILSGGSLFGLLTSRAALRLGNISYDLYLLQGPVLYLVFGVPKIKAFALDSSISYWLVTLSVGLLLLIVSATSHVCLEVPAILFGRRLALRVESRFR